MYIYRFFTDGCVYIYAIELRKIGCLFSFSYVSTAGVFVNKVCLGWSGVFAVGRGKGGEFATGESGIHISPKIESVLMNIYIYAIKYSRLTKSSRRDLHISPGSSLTAGLIFMNWVMSVEIKIPSVLTTQVL